MVIEQSAGAIIFRKEGGKIYYLLLEYPSMTSDKKNYWGFPKGHIEENERKEEAASREILEETGLKDLKFIPGFKESISYFFRRENKLILKKVIYFLAQTDSFEVKISGEHTKFLWLLFPQACEKITHQNLKKILKKAHEFIQRKGLTDRKEDSKGSDSDL